jgi:hypothetical protein
MVDPTRQLTPDEWETLAGFVGDAETMWGASERRLEMLRMLAERSVRWLTDLTAMRAAIRAHRDETEHSSVYWPADVRLWELVAEAAYPDSDGDGFIDDGGWDG